MIENKPCISTVNLFDSINVSTRHYVINTSFIKIAHVAKYIQIIRAIFHVPVVQSSWHMISLLKVHITIPIGRTEDIYDSSDSVYMYCYY